MNNKIWSFATMSLITFTFAFGVFSETLYAKKDKDTKPEALSLEEKSEIKKQTLIDLNGAEWSLTMYSMDASKRDAPIEDTITFKNAKLHSVVMEEKGYGESNISINVKDDGKVEFETMQSGPDLGPVFWRGKLREESVSGVMSQTIGEGKIDAYSFSGKLMGTVEVAPPEEIKIIEAPVFEEIPEPEPVMEPVEEVVEDVADEVMEEAVDDMAVEEDELDSLNLDDKAMEAVSDKAGDMLEGAKDIGDEDQKMVDVKGKGWFR